MTPESNGQINNYLIHFSVRDSFQPDRLDLYLVESDIRAPKRAYALVCHRRKMLVQDDWEVPIARAAVRRLMTQLAGIQVSPLADWIMGLDGATSKLSFKWGFNTLAVQWWGNLPPQWRPLAPVLRRLKTWSGRGTQSRKAGRGRGVRQH